MTSAGQLAGLLGAGLVAGSLVPGNTPGVGLALAWSTTAVAVLAARPVSTWAGPWRRVMVCLAASAAALPAWSDAAWTVVPAMLSAVVVAVLAFGGGASWLGLARPTLRSPLMVLAALPVLGAALRRLVPADVQRHPALRAAVLTALVTGVFGSLFASADRVFGRFVERFLVPDLVLERMPLRGVVAVIVVVGAATLARLRFDGHDDRPLPPPARSLHGIEWQAPLWALTGLFAGFVALQFGVLFGGHQQVLQTAGLTYAEYARGGFGQLLVVAGLTLGVLGATRRYAAGETDAERRRQTGLLAGLCLLTLVVLASAWHRLGLYQDAYGYTRLRFAAACTILWLAGVFALVLVTGAARRTARLPRLVAMVTAAAMLGVAYARPDAQIAAWNVQRFAQEGRIDLAYVADLSADAVPALLELPPSVRGCPLGAIAAELAAPDDWPEWNRARVRAADLLERSGPLPACDDMGRWG